MASEAPRVLVRFPDRDVLYTIPELEDALRKALMGDCVTDDGVFECEGEVKDSIEALEELIALMRRHNINEIWVDGGFIEITYSDGRTAQGFGRELFEETPEKELLRNLHTDVEIIAWALDCILEQGYVSDTNVIPDGYYITIMDNDTLKICHRTYHSLA